MAPIQVMRWIKQTYPKPIVNSEWLEACCAWVADEMHLNPATQTDAFIAEVENQLLESDLRDSMEPGTGLPRDSAAMNNQRIRGAPHILVEIIAITEIGHSAFNLHNTRQARIERADLAGLAQEEGAEDDEGPVPNYPRSMLKLELSDGSITIPAIEYRSIPTLKLDETPLGFKLLLKDVLVRRGIIFLEPRGIVLKGHRNSDRDEFRDQNFVHGLLRRMMKPVPREEQQADGAMDENQPPPQGPPLGLPASAAQAREPLRDLYEPPEPPNDDMDMDDEAELPRKRRVPNPTAGSGRPPPLTSSSTQIAPSMSSSSTLVASRFFGYPSASNATNAAIEATTQRLARVLSPVRGDPIDITDSSMEDPGPSSRVMPVQSGTGSLRASSSGNPSTHPKRISYDEFEFDDDDEEMDAAFLDEIAKVERDAFKGQGQGQGQSARNIDVAESRAATHLRNVERRSNTPIAGGHLSSFATITPASTIQSFGQATSQPVRSHPQMEAPIEVTQTKSSTRVDAQEVITIEDDDNEDKENIPVPRRRVRRRISTPPPEDVIDISD